MNVTQLGEGGCDLCKPAKPGGGSWASAPHRDRYTFCPYEAPFEEGAAMRGSENYLVELADALTERQVAATVVHDRAGWAYLNVLDLHRHLRRIYLVPE